MNIEALRRKSDWLAHDGHEWRVVWPRIESLNHFLKTHKTRLAADGAIIKLGREWLISADRFPTVARQILGLPGESE